MTETTQLHTQPILVTGAAGDVGGIGRNVTALLLARGFKAVSYTHLTLPTKA